MIFGKNRPAIADENTTTAVHHQPGDHCYLLGLPTELRLRIYDYVFENPAIIPDEDVRLADELAFARQLLVGCPLLFTSRLILDEALPVYREVLIKWLECSKKHVPSLADSWRPRLRSTVIRTWQEGGENASARVRLVWRLIGSCNQIEVNLRRLRADLSCLKLLSK